MGDVAFCYTLMVGLLPPVPYHHLKSRLTSVPFASFPETGEHSAHNTRVPAKHLTKPDLSVEMFVHLPLSLHLALTAANVKAVSDVWWTVGSCQLPIVALLWALDSENWDGGGGKGKHTGSFSPLPRHLRFVEGFSPNHFHPIEK